jgi:hypothetical protein
VNHLKTFIIITPQSYSTRFDFQKSLYGLKLMHAIVMGICTIAQSRDGGELANNILTPLFFFFFFLQVLHLLL